MIRINGAKIIIRELNKNDVQSLFRNAKDKEVARYITRIPIKFEMLEFLLKNLGTRLKKDYLMNWV